MTLTTECTGAGGPFAWERILRSGGRRTYTYHLTVAR
jgi:hypothetical protein